MEPPKLPPVSGLPPEEAHPTVLRVTPGNPATPIQVETVLRLISTGTVPAHGLLVGEVEVLRELAPLLDGYCKDLHDGFIAAIPEALVIWRPLGHPDDPRLAQIADRIPLPTVELDAGILLGRLATIYDGASCIEVSGGAWPVVRQTASPRAIILRIRRGGRLASFPAGFEPVISQMPASASPGGDDVVVTLLDPDPGALLTALGVEAADPTMN